VKQSQWRISELVRTFIYYEAVTEDI